MQNSQNLQKKAKAELAKRELARRGMQHFSKYTYPQYVEGWHTNLICEALDKLETGEIRWLLIEAPPRHSKTIHVSQLFPAYAVGKNEDRDIIVASYSGDLASRNGRETRNLIKSKLYQNVFDTKLAPDSESKNQWNTQGTGAYNAVGIGGSTTGKGADIFVIDDPMKDRKEADSLVMREGLWDWYRSVARTRLSPKGGMVILHTRWHEDDLIGRLTTGKETKENWVDYFDYKKNGLGDAKWVRLTLKGIAEQDELPYRKKGEALHPERFSVEELEDIKLSLGPYEFSALYQANPVDDANREFKKDWFQYRPATAIQEMNVRRFATIDPNLKKSDQSDYCGVVRNYINDKNQWNIKATRYRVNSKEVLDLIFMLHDEGFESIGVEEGAFSYVIEPFLKEEMQKRGKFPNVVPLKHNQTMKEVRIRGLIPWYAAYQIFHIEEECNDLEEELLAFPKGTHDDVADALAYQLQIAEAPASELARMHLEEMDTQRASNNAARLGL